MALMTASVIALLIGLGSPSPGAPPRAGDRPNTGRPLQSNAGRGLISGNGRALASTGTDRPLISMGTNRPLLSTGTDRPLASTGSFRPLQSTGQDRALQPTGGLPDAPPASATGTDRLASVQVVPDGSSAPSADAAAAPPAAANAPDSPAGQAASPMNGSANSLADPAANASAGVAGAAAPAVRSAVATRFGAMLGEARQAMGTRDFHRAEQILYSVRSAEPGAWSLRVHYAANLLALGHYDRSMAELMTALKHRANDDALPSPADLFGSQEVFGEVLERLREYRRGNPADAQAQLLEIELSSLAGEQEHATTLLQELREHHRGWEPIDLIAGLATSAARAKPQNASASTAP